MLKKIIIGCFVFLLFPLFSFAQEDLAHPEFTGELKADIQAENNVEVNKSIIFDASISHYDHEKPVTFIWDLGDGTIVEGEEIVHVFRQPGRFIVRLTVEQEEQKDHKEIFVYVYEKIFFLITNNQAEQESVFRFIEDARKSGIFIKLIDNFIITGTTTEEILVKKLTENVEEFDIDFQAALDFRPVTKTEITELLAASEPHKGTGLEVYKKKI